VDLNNSEPIAFFAGSIPERSLSSSALVCGGNIRNEADSGLAAFGVRKSYLGWTNVSKGPIAIFADDLKSGRSMAAHGISR
jgi:hypothetical protein